jgi:hypothetical protein
MAPAAQAAILLLLALAAILLLLALMAIFLVNVMKWEKLMMDAMANNRWTTLNDDK